MKPIHHEPEARNELISVLIGGCSELFVVNLSSVAMTKMYTKVY